MSAFFIPETQNGVLVPVQVTEEETTGKMFFTTESACKDYCKIINKSSGVEEEVEVDSKQDKIDIINGLNEFLGTDQTAEIFKMCKDAYHSALEHMKQFTAEHEGETVEMSAVEPLLKLKGAFEFLSTIFDDQSNMRIIHVLDSKPLSERIKDELKNKL